MKTFMMLMAAVMLVSGFAACRKPDLQGAAGMREVSRPPGSPQPVDEKGRGGKGTEGNGDGMQNFAAGEIIVKFKPRVTPETVERIARAHDLEIVKIVSPPQLYLFKIRGTVPVREIAGRLNALAEVEYAEPNYRRQTQ